MNTVQGSDARSTVGACQAVRDLHDQHIPIWGSYREAMEQERAFLAGDRFEDDNGAYQRDKRLIQIRGEEIADTIRHIVADATSRHRSIEARPIDMQDDKQAAEVASSLLEWEFSNPWKMFEDELEQAITAARESRLGIVWADYDPDLDEILYRYADGTRFMWDPRYHPHHPKCGWLLEEMRVHPSEIKALYGVDVQPDRDSFSTDGAIKPGVPLIKGSTGETLPDTKIRYDDGLTTLWRMWYKNDRTAGDAKDRPEMQTKLSADRRYMVCLGQCGYRTPNQQQLKRMGSAFRLPPMLPRGCPTCSGDLERIDATQPVDTVFKYPRGKRLVVFCPFQANAKADDPDAPIYNGGWPIPELRSFPGCFITCYTKPGKPMGPCDTTLMWDQQVASDQLATLMLQRVFEHRNYWIMPGTGINDADGLRFEFRDNQHNVMFRDMRMTEYGPLQVEQVAGIGLDPAATAVYQVIQGKLIQYRGIADFGLSPEDSKNIPVGTVQTIEKQADIPLEHFKRKLKREVSRFGGVVWDMLKATVTPEKLQRLRMKDIDYVTSLSGDDLPNYDFVIEDSPDFHGLDENKSKALTSMMQAAQQAAQLGLDPAKMVDLFAKLNNFPPSIVRDFQELMSDAKAKADAANAAAESAGGGMPGGPGAPAEPGAPNETMAAQAA